MKYVAALALCAALAMANESSARADEDPALAPKQKTHWYGWQTLSLDVAAIALTIGSQAATSSGAQVGVAASGISLFALGPPLVHAFHGRYGAMGIDFALRVALPLIGAGLGYAIGVATLDNHKAKDLGDAVDTGIENTFNLSLAFFGGVALGTVSAVAIDASLLAEEPIKPKTLTWAPTVTPRAGGATAGVAGTF